MSSESAGLFLFNRGAMTMARASRDMILWFFLALFILSLFLLGNLFWPFLSVIILASVVSSLFYPIYVYLEKRLKPIYASFLTCILIFFVLFIPIVSFITILTSEARDLVLLIKGTGPAAQVVNLLESHKIIEKMNGIFTKFHITLSYAGLVQPISDLATYIGKSLINQANTIAGHLLNIIIDFFLMLLITYYLLIDGRRLIRFIIDLSPLPNEQEMILIRKFEEMSAAVLIGNGVSWIIQGTAGGIIFAVFNLHSPILWGVIMAFLAFLPIVGIGVVMVPAAVFVALQGRFFASICIFVLYIVITAGVENLLKPALVGKRMNMHSLLVFFSIIGGLYMSGILGIIYGPLIMTFFLTLTDIYNSNYKKLIEPERDPSFDDINLI